MLFDLSGSLKAENGPGWILTLVEGMRAEWGCTLKQAVFGESLTAALVLWPALLARHGAEVHLNHADRARQTAKEAKRKHIAEHYHVVKGPPVSRRPKKKAGN